MQDELKKRFFLFRRHRLPHRGEALKIVDLEEPILIDLIAFDGDDTLWHDLPLFHAAVGTFKELLRGYADEERIDQVLLETETRNLRHFGYGVKGFTLSLIETALDLTEERIPASRLRAILELGKETMASPVELLPGAREAVAALSHGHRLLLVTKGELFHQEAKVARSRIGNCFCAVEIVASKDRAAYEMILARHGVAPERFLMVGNSLPSDIVPVLALGGYGVHIPYSADWSHETLPEGQYAELLEGGRYFQIPEIASLPQLVERINR